MSRFSISTSSSFTLPTGDAEVSLKVTDAKSAKARIKRAKRDMEDWIGWHNGFVKQVG